MALTLQFLLFVGGHAAGALLFYFFHRVIFHGPLARYPIFKQWAVIHARHHAHPGEPGAFFFPWWANITVWAVALGLCFASPAFGAGMITFFLVYAYRHSSAHNGSQSNWAQHHQSHHYVKPRGNFSSTYPVIDRVFGTYHRVDPDAYAAKAIRARAGNTEQRGKVGP